MLRRNSAFIFVGARVYLPPKSKLFSLDLFGLAWISLDEFAGRADRLASPVRLIELGAKRKPKLRSIALELADVSCV